MSRGSRGVPGDEYVEYLHNVIPDLYVLIVDTYDIPRKASRLALQIAGKYLSSPQLKALFNSPLFLNDTDPAQPPSVAAIITASAGGTGGVPTFCAFDELFKAITGHLIVCFPQRLNVYVQTLLTYLTPDRPPFLKQAATLLLGMILR